jgi:hypothetical protein
MNSPVLICIVLSILVPPLRAQKSSSAPKQWGTINGEAIPDRTLNIQRDSAVTNFIYKHRRLPDTSTDEQEIASELQRIQCGRLRDSVTSAAREIQKRQFGITVTKKELDEVRRTMHLSDPAAAAAKLHAQSADILSALSAVYDTGEDPNQVFVRMIKPLGIDEGLWAVYYLWQGRQPQGRAIIAQGLAMTPEAYAKGSASVDLRPLAERQKLEQAVDRHLASADPTFQAYLAERDRARQNPDPRKHWMKLEHSQYLDQKRAEWWRSQTSKLQVVLSDPSLLTTCGLRKMGVSTGERK